MSRSIKRQLDDLKRLGSRPVMPSNCPIREFAGDGVPVGRCWTYLGEGTVCSRHGDVSEAVKRYKATGKLTNDPRYEEKGGGGR
jgi:hypothetical protein